MSNSLLILFPTQLFDFKYIKKILEYTDEETPKSKNSHVILWEHDHFFNDFPYHKMKLAFGRATFQSYYDKLIENKSLNLKSVEYVESVDKNPSQTINKLIKKNKIDRVMFFNPIEKKLLDLIDSGKILTKINIEYDIFPSPYFLNSLDPNTNTEIQESMGSTRHDIFYKIQRIKYNIMVKKSGDKYIPDGSKWSFDRENRDKFEKDQEEPPILQFKSKTRKDYIEEAIEYVEKNYKKNYGTCNYDDFIYPIDHEEASKWLEQFVKTKLDNFGKYEDALSSKIKFGYHSVTSCLTNVGLLSPKQILSKISAYKKNIASKEGFIRQLIGWREYCYFTYDKYYSNLVSTSIYVHNKNKIPKKVWEGKTLMPVIDNIIKNVNTYAYSHHIERLMGIGNFLLLIGTSPDQIYFWFQSMYIDAYDVFMVPNVYGMLLYAKTDDKNRMMTRPYFCSSNYLMKMSDFKSSEITFGDVTCKWDEVFDALYYNLIDTYSDVYEKIYATASSVSRWKKFNSKRKTELKSLAKSYLDWIKDK